MIISGGARSNGKFFGKHLMKTTENEVVNVVEIRGLMYAETVPEAFREMSAMATGTRCKNFFYHANLNPRADELLTPEQWEHAVDTLEHELGLDGHSRFIVEHQKEGRTHRHVVWSRIDPETGITASDGKNYAAHERAARSLEAAFGHAAVVGAHASTTGQRPERRPKNWETFRGHESRIDPAEVARELTGLWQSADSGMAFAAALWDRGYRLCKGDRRDYCVVDQAGDVHSLARRVQRVKAKEIRDRLADIDPVLVPTIATAQAEVQAIAAAKPVEIQPAPIETPATTIQVPVARPAAPKAPILAPDIWVSGEPTALEIFREQLNAAIRHRTDAAPSPGGLPPSKANPAPERPPESDTTLQRFARTLAEVMCRNDGSTHHGFTRLDRAIAVLEIAGQAAEWMREKWQQFTRDRDRDDGHDR